MPTYRANWRLRGIKGLTLEPGRTIELTAPEAARFVARGVLSLCADQPAAAAPAVVPTIAAPVVTPPVDLFTMSKAQLVDYGRAHLKLRLDVAKPKAELLAAIAKAAGK
jgi:hypothetical protein